MQKGSYFRMDVEMTFRFILPLALAVCVLGCSDSSRLPRELPSIEEIYAEYGCPPTVYFHEIPWCLQLAHAGVPLRVLSPPHVKLEYMTRGIRIYAKIDKDGREIVEDVVKRDRVVRDRRTPVLGKCRIGDCLELQERCKLRSGCIYLYVIENGTSSDVSLQLSSSSDRVMAFLGLEQLRPQMETVIALASMKNETAEITFSVKRSESADGGKKKWLVGVKVDAVLVNNGKDVQTRMCE